MAIQENPVLNMPFDEAVGSKKAFDYSANRADGILSEAGADFVAGKQGNCMQFDGTGKVEVDASVLNLSQPFSICTYIKAPLQARTYVVLFNFAGQNNYYQHVVNIVPDTWYYLVVTHERGSISIYLNGTLIKKDVMPVDTYGNPIGVSVSQACYNTELGKGCIDEVKLYQHCFTQDEVQDLQGENKSLAYLLDGVDFKEYGVHVSKSKGLMDGLKMKEPTKVNFDGYHGSAVDLSRPRFEEREITLECFMEVRGGKMEFVRNVQNFIKQFTAKHTNAAYPNSLCPAGLHRLTVDIHPTKPLLYEVYLPDATDIDKTWNDKRMVGTFTLALKEPEPVKMVLKQLCVSDATKRVSITLSTSKLINIYWGDGTTMQDVYGDNITITHDYAENGDYFIIITGVIEELENIETNAIIVWDEL